MDSKIAQFVQRACDFLACDPADYNGRPLIDLIDDLAMETGLIDTYFVDDDLDTIIHS